MSDWRDTLPKSIRIGPFDIPVIFDQDEALRREDSWGSYHHGVGLSLRTDHPSGPMVVDTLMHEILHGIYRSSGMPQNKEERTVTGLATGLTQVFRDNPDLLTWIGAQLGRPA